ncbi:MAG: hypothetical protein MRY83_12100 [Flavobacteriales bacterium]|nr:hypothetical protein [Flavobacteriales bacterium]
MAQSDVIEMSQEIAEYYKIQPDFISDKIEEKEIIKPRLIEALLVNRTLLEEKKLAHNQMLKEVESNLERLENLETDIYRKKIDLLESIDR